MAATAAAAAAALSMHGMRSTMVWRRCMKRLSDQKHRKQHVRRVTRHHMRGISSSSSTGSSRLLYHQPALQSVAGRMMELALQFPAAGSAAVACQNCRPRFHSGATLRMSSPAYSNSRALQFVIPAILLKGMDHLWVQLQTLSSAAAKQRQQLLPPCTALRKLPIAALLVQQQ
jgi:hypothetical protein